MIPRELFKKVRRIQIQSRHQVNDVFAGAYHSAFKGQGIEFEEVREYVPGDDIRSIDWNVTARSGHPFIKKFREERERTLMLMVDVSASHLFGSASERKKDLAAEVSAVFALSAIQNHDRVGLILFSDDVEKYIPPNKGLSHVLRVIREILYFQPTRTGTAVVPALDFLNHVSNRRAVSFLFSDFRTQEALDKPLSVTGRRHDLTAVLVRDHREYAWPKSGLVEWMDAETGQRHLVDTSSSAVRRALLTQEEQRVRDHAILCRRAGVDRIVLETKKDGEEETYEKELIRFFQERKRRRVR